MSVNSSNGPSRRTVLAGLATPLFAGETSAQTPPSPALAPLPRTAQTLVLSERRVALKPDAPDSTMFSINGQSPASIIRMQKGQTLDLTIENKLSVATGLHIHGLRGPNASEGVPGLGSTPIQPGETRTMPITGADSGIFLILPVLQGQAAEQLERGLAGVLIVDEPKPQPVDLDHVALLDDIALWNTGPNAGTLIEPFDRRLDGARLGRLGNALLTNGKPSPESITVRPSARVRLRLANLANARVMPMKFTGGRQTVVAIDGQACDPFDPLKRTVVLLPGSRYEMMIDMPSEAGQESQVLIDTGTLHKVLIFKAEGEPLPPRPPVQPLPINDVPASIRLQNAARSELAITGGMERTTAEASKPLPDEAELAKRWPDRTKIWQINSGFNSGFSGKPLFTVKRNTPVVLALTNRSAWPQVLTIHGHVFRLLHPLDDGWEPYFLDTIHLPAMTTSRVAFDAVNPGKWAIRSTIAEHYDAGVATWFEVT